MSAASLKKGLLAQGFREGKSEKLLRRELFDDYIAVIATESGQWGKGETDAYLFLQSRRFAEVLDKVFDSSSFPFAEYEPRKMDRDPSGRLAEGLAGIETHDKKPSLYSAAIHLDTKRLGKLLDAMNSPGGFYGTLYRSELSAFLWLTEGSWVFQYLAAEAGFTPAEALLELSSNDAVRRESRRWHLKKAPDIQVIEAFFAVYHATVDGKRSGAKPSSNSKIRSPGRPHRPRSARRRTS